MHSLFGRNTPPKTPRGTLQERSRAYIPDFPDHWGRKRRLKELCAALRFAAKGPAAAIKAELGELLNQLDVLYALAPYGPAGDDNPWWPTTHDPDG